MFRKIVVCLCIAVCACPVLPAQENNEVFLSLTRHAEPIADLPTSVSTVPNSQIRAKESLTLSDAINNQLSINVSQQGTVGQNSTLSIRGSSSEQVLVLIDGRRINSVSLGTADLSSIPANRIDHIEIIRGSASAQYGTSAFGGVVNVITKRAAENTPLFDVGASYGSFNTQDYSITANLRRDALSAMVTADKTLTDGWRKNSDLDADDFLVNLGYDAGNIGKFDLSGSLFRSDLGVPGPITGLTPSMFNGTIEKTASTPDARQTYDKRYIRLTHTTPGETRSLKTIVYASDDKLNFNVPSWFSNTDYDSPVFGTELQYNAGYGLTVGGEWWEEKHKQTDLLLNTDVIDRSRVNTAGYVQEQFNAGRFLFIPELRYDDNSAFGSVMTPRLSVVYRASDALKLSANSGKTWRAPTFNELYYPLDPWGFAGNPDLKPEEGISSDIGAEYRFGTYRTALTLFQTDTDNLIVWGMTPQNIGKSRQRGAEFEIGGKIVSGVSHRLGYTYLWAEDLDANTQLIYRPQNMLNYTVACLLPWNSKADLSAQYVGSQKTETAGVRLPEYTLVGLRLAHTIGSAEIWVKGDNLLDTKYETRLGFPLPGLTVAGGVTVKFWDTAR
jgi:outer membrane receptor for ferrienterochelin and colicins